MSECRKCSILHQHVDMNAEDYSNWYRDRYHNGVYTHSYDHDVAVSKLRLAAYDGFIHGPVLDVGSGNGAFVDTCRNAGLEATGLDLGGTSEHKCHIEEMTGTYGTITMHDVLEHAINPVSMLQSAHRLLEDDGKLIIDFPDFHSPDGEHHWKPVEHLWMLTIDDLSDLTWSTGFRIKRSTTPVPGKIVLYLDKR